MTMHGPVQQSLQQKYTSTSITTAFQLANILWGTETVAPTQVQPSCTPSSQEMMFLIEREETRPGSQCGCAQLSTCILTLRQQNKPSNKPCRQNSTQDASTSHKPCPKICHPSAFLTNNNRNDKNNNTHRHKYNSATVAFQAFRCQLCGDTAL